MTNYTLWTIAMDHHENYNDLEATKNEYIVSSNPQAVPLLKCKSHGESFVLRSCASDLLASARVGGVR